MAQKIFSSPSELYEFVDKVILELKSKGLDALPLQNIQSTAFTTGNEWRGELREAVVKILKYHIKDKKILMDLRIIFNQAMRCGLNKYLIWDIRLLFRIMLLNVKYFFNKY